MAATSPNTSLRINPIIMLKSHVFLLSTDQLDLYAADAASGGHARLRLRSMYADNPDDSLLFQVL